MTKRLQGPLLKFHCCNLRQLVLTSVDDSRVPVFDKMAGLLKLNMNDSSFLGSLDAITDTMQTYKDNGGRFSVAEWKSLPQPERNRLMGQDVTAGAPKNVPPVGSIPIMKNGTTVGYVLNGKRTNFPVAQ